MVQNATQVLNYDVTVNKRIIMYVLFNYGFYYFAKRNEYI